MNTQIQNQTPLAEKAAMAIEAAVAGSGVGVIADEGKNHYEERQQRRRERYEGLAGKARNESRETLAKARQMQSIIPFGQPILVGHHSEGRDRNFRNKIHNTYGKGFALDDKADYYENKAASVGTGGISGDDPEAIAKLKAQLDMGRAVIEENKRARQVIGKSKTYEIAFQALLDAGFSDPGQYLTKGADTYWFNFFLSSNLRANMSRIQKRIEGLEKLQNRGDKEEQGEGYVYREDTAENRIMFVFTGKPAEAIRAVLKAAAFKWSPTRSAWVRQLTPNALWTAKRARKEIDELAAAAQTS
jgi:hypothetical protein